MYTLILSDKAGKSFQKKEKILYALTALFFISLYFPSRPVINNIFIGLLCAYCLAFNPVKEKIQLLKQRKAILCMILFYLLHVVSTGFSVNKPEAVRLLSLRVPLLIFPISLGLIFIREELKDRIIRLFSFVVAVVCLVCLISAMGVFVKTHDPAFLYNDSLADILGGMQSIYLALMVNLAIAGYIYLLVTSSPAIAFRAGAYLIVIFLVVIDFMLASRVAIMYLCLGLLSFSLYYIVKKRKYLEGATLVMGLLIGSVLLVKVFPKTINRFRELNYTSYQFSNQGVESHYNMAVTADQWNGANIRLAVWKCGWELTREHLFTGVPLGDKRGKMQEIFKEKHFDFAYRSERNMHNTYLDVLCIFGIFGLTLFLLAYFIFPLISCYRSGDGLGVFLLLAFAFSMISETVIDRSIGSILLGFFSVFVVAGCRGVVPADYAD